MVIFIKNPELGKVKTRIAVTTSDERALEIYKELLHNTHNIAMSTDVHRILYYSSFIDTKDDWKSKYFDKKLQSGDNLGLKMYNAIRSELQSHDKVVLIGSDIGALTSDIIDLAFDALEETDVVIGPATDGGYYLIGMTTDKDVFQGITWSSSMVLKDTLDLVNQHGLSYHLLTSLSDIDFIEDYDEWKAGMQL